ncbi:unnamed protein product [Symbiodinium natans]|uniref:AB hydrolase-1 domain-containing protein n=1 Tax=Symbiodinium natans TaxID=878477 RepID=A0A812IF75_9DINO|nr:unnamed protein product [Symbiodinium natans]
MAMKSCFVEVCGREMHYTEWGADASWPDKPVLIMWHGLTRCARDFDIPAKYYSDIYRVLCPDTLGRGLSQWAVEMEEYSVRSYAKQAGEFVSKTCGENAIVDWFGTSMGGIIAINACTAGGPLDGRIRKLLLNDIGPELNQAAIQEIAKNAGNQPIMDKFTDLVAHLRRMYEVAVGPAEGELDFTLSTQHIYRRLPDGRYTLHFDPRIGTIVQQRATRLVSESDDPWTEYDKCTAKEILAVRGTKSMLLLEEGHQKLASRGLACPVRLVEVPDKGHAPLFATPEELQLSDSFFRDGQSQCALQ